MEKKPLTNSRIGIRYVETHDRLKLIASYDDKLSDTERVFIDDLLEKLELYKENTFVSVAQLNWINRIEDKVIDL